MKEEILKLRTGQVYVVPESDYGKAEVWRINSTYFIFSIPMFGGEPSYEDSYRVGDEDKVVATINSWT